MCRDCDFQNIGPGEFIGLELLVGEPRSSQAPLYDATVCSEEVTVLETSVAKMREVFGSRFESVCNQFSLLGEQELHFRASRIEVFLITTTRKKIAYNGI